MRVIISTLPQRRKPQIGDRRTTKKHGEQIRVVTVHDGRWVVTRHGACHEWRSPGDLVGTQWEYLLQDADRKALAQKAFAKQHLKDVETSIFFGVAA